MVTHTRTPWLLLIPLLPILLVPFMTHAESVVWSGSGGGGFKWTPKGGEHGVRASVGSMQVSVRYNVQVINSSTGGVLGASATVPTGTNLSFQFIPHQDTDITWFVSGNVYDTPYGSWVSGAGRPGNLGANTNLIGRGRKTTKNTPYLFASYTAQPPAKSIAGFGGNSCSGAGNDSMNCTMTQPGTYAVQFQFNGTPGKFWFGAGQGSRTVRWTTSRDAPVPTQTITYTITVEPENAANQPPTMTTLASVGQCVVGQNHTITMVSADQDANDQLRYLIDWDNNDSVDQIVPPSGYVNPGVSQTASRTYATEGEKTVKVRAEDKAGALSAWESITFTCSNPPPPPPPPETQCSDGIDNDGDGLIDNDDPDCSDSADGSEFSTPPPPPGPGPADLSIKVVPFVVRSGGTTQVSWSATNVDSCVVNGDNGDAWAGVSSPVEDQTSSPITQRTIYTLSCIDLEDETQTKTETVNIVPVWSEF